MTRRKPQSRGRRALGYTIVELLMSLSVLAIGASGVMAMQKVTLATNRHARSLMVATRIAQAWADQLAADAALWTPNAVPSPRAKTEWLNAADPNAAAAWVIPSPAYSSARGFGAAFDSLGKPVDPGARPALAHFCTHLRLAFMHSETTPTVGNSAIRAQIRIFWRRENSATDPPGGANLCSVSPSQFDAGIESLHVIYLTTAVRESSKGRI